MTLCKSQGIAVVLVSAMSSQVVTGNAANVSRCASTMCAVLRQVRGLWHVLQSAAASNPLCVQDTHNASITVVIDHQQR